MIATALFFDDASRFNGELTHEEAELVAKNLLETFKSIRRINKKFALNTSGPISNYFISENHTIKSIFSGNDYREEWDFIKNLNDRSPFADGLENFVGEINGMEFCTLESKVPSVAIAWASLLDSGIVSFDAHKDWSQPWIQTSFSILDDNGDIKKERGVVRNTSRTEHVIEHSDWLQKLGTSEFPSASQIWAEKLERFPGMRFLDCVEKDLLMLENSGTPFDQAFLSLVSLENDIATWHVRNAKPDFSRKTTREHEQRKKLCWFQDDATGMLELFDWHTRFTGGLAGRIHFRIDTVSHKVVIAYVGCKLE